MNTTIIRKENLIMKKTFIKCSIIRLNGEKALEFRAEKDGNSYFLFNQRYYKSSYDYFKNSVPVSDALDYSDKRRNRAMTNVVNRLASSLRYIEKYYSVNILEKCRPSARRTFQPDMSAEY